ncbi:MAG: divalent cation tolerance protein CutA [Xanthomonadales bacterium]|nr:divalent cation tolerance protein CutA [Xanthomonadales bacterium]
MTEILVVRVNCASRDEAREIAGAAIARRLAAAANIHPPIDSLYRWQGKVETVAEVPLELKTRADLFDPLAELISEMHSYQTPAILGIPAAKAAWTYAHWIEAETEPRT